MDCKPTQRDIVIIDFAPFKGYKIRKQRPTLVISKDSHDISTNLIIACPVTSLDRGRPFPIPIYSEKLHTSDNAAGEVNTLQICSLDYTKQTRCRIKYIGMSGEETFCEIAQKFL